MKCGFGIGYGSGHQYPPIWVSVSVSDLNQISGFGRTLAGGSTSSTTLKLGTLKRVKKMDGDDGGVMAQPTFMLHQPSEPKKKIQKRRKQFIKISA